MRSPQRLDNISGAGRGNRRRSRFRVLATVLAVLAVLAAAAPVAAATGAADGLQPTVTQYRLPFLAGRQVLIGQGWHNGYSHVGRGEYAYDFSLPLGATILAAADGTVRYVHAGETACGGAEALDEANYISIDHPDGTATLYGHLSEPAVAEGDVVTRGQVIGRAGATGFTNCRPHLHFARQAQGAPVTQSLPVYFLEYPGLELLDGRAVEAAALEVEADNQDAFLAEVEQRLAVIDQLEARQAMGIDTGTTPALPYRLARLAYP
jgi:murein DD-endopeptidase MepM/ murein hydrolase activator NlpD